MLSCNNFLARDSEKRRVLFFSSCATLLVLAGAYNIDTDDITVFEDPKSFRSLRESYFGFSVALYVGPDGNSADASVLVGAPRANVSATPSVLEPGAIYRCSLKGTCVEWNLDPTKNGPIDGYPYIRQIKDHAWIGGTIGVENKRQPKVVVCAPRWQNESVVDAFMNGMCYWSTIRDSTTFDKRAESSTMPLNDLARQISPVTHEVYCRLGEAGFSIHMFAEGEQSKLLLGAPGILLWEGMTLLSNYSDRRMLPDIENKPFITYFDYFGYSVTSGNYFGPRDRWYASGAPRGGNFTGRVLIYRFSELANKKLNVRKTLDGEQYGEYFGASLASCDLNNDGRDEIVVGAPLWTRYMDEGRVYTYTVKSNGDFELQYIEGEVTGARFGSVVTCLGDLDHDGYGDIAVGAPYENDHGAVYIYNGNKNAISEPRDVDGNSYADLAIGAYGSGHVALLRSRPVVTMRVSAIYVGTKELRSNSTSFAVKVCSFYDGVEVPEQLSVERILKVDALQGRAFYGNDRRLDGTYHIPETLRRGKNHCDEIRINLVPRIQNVMDPVNISVSLALVNRPTDEKSCFVCPVVNKGLSKIEDSLTLPFALECGPDKVCLSLLELAISGDLEDGDRYTLGSKPTVRLAVEVGNRGEPAYKVQTHILVPSPISLGSVPRECAENQLTDKILEVICELGNPLRNREISILELDMSGVRSDTGRVELSARVSTQSDNFNSANDTRNLTIYFDVDADIAIAGKSQEGLYSYFSEEEKRLETIRFQHIYEVQKFGKSSIEKSILTVLVPTHLRGKGDVIEIAHVNQTFGVMEGKRFYCNDWSRTIDDEGVDDVIFADSSVKKTSTFKRSSKPYGNQTSERFSIEENSTMSVPPENRTFFLNCTNPAVECTRISCELGTFASSLTVAKLTVTLDMQLRDFLDKTTEARDIIFFVSNGSAAIVQPRRVVQRAENKPDSTIVGTTFVSSPVVRPIIASPVALWIIVLAVLLGMLLLALLTLGLAKSGFFHRKKREELEALKAASDGKHGLVLETASSSECLDQD